MGLWDFIKSKLFKKDRQALPEPTVVDTPKHELKNNFTEFINVGYTPEPPKEYLPKVGTIEFAIQQYLYGLQMQHQRGQDFNSYGALTSICGIDTTEAGNNKQNEINFMSRIRNEGKVNIIDQTYENNPSRVAFRHIQNERHPYNTDTRLYINCKRENVAILAEKFYEEFGDKPYYFKFCSDDQSRDNRRSEQFVFYLNSEPHELNGVIQTIENTRQKYPELFEGAQHKNPFLKDVKGYICYAPDVKNGVYNRIDGSVQKIDKSYNSLLGAALTDSFTHAMSDMVSRDYNLTKKMQGQYFDQPQPFVANVLEDVLTDREMQKQLIEKIKNNLEICSMKNHYLSIRGLEEQNKGR